MARWGRRQELTLSWSSSVPARWSAAPMKGGVERVLQGQRAPGGHGLPERRLAHPFHVDSAYGERSYFVPDASLRSTAAMVFSHHMARVALVSLTLM
ncbi:hypothetical protein BH24ACI4_BH24ACI4_23800 [soil metagenome]